MPSIKLPREFSSDFLGLGVKPKHAVRIRKGHPLANGIIACSVGGVPMDLYTQEKQTGSFPAKQKGSYYFSGDDYLNSACCHALNPDGVTLAFVGDSDNDDTNNRRALSVSDSGNANRRVAISYVSQDRMRLNSNDGTTNVLCDIESVTGSEYVGAVAFGARELWSSRKMISEGAKVASSTESTSLSTSNLDSFDTVTVGNRYNSGAAPGSSEYWKGRHDIAVVWNRDIGDTALKNFLNNPWQILEPANDLYIFVPSGAGGGYTLTADSAAFSNTPADAGLKADRNVSADSATFNYTAQSADLAKGYNLVGESGAFVYTGTDAGLRAARTLSGDSASYSVTAQDAALKKDSKLAADSASFSFTAQDATLTYDGTDPTLSAESASFTWTAQSADLRVARVLSADSASYVYTAQDATLTYNTGYTLVAESASYSLTSADAGLRADRTLTAEASSFNYSAQDAGVFKGFNLSAESGAYTLTPEDAGFIYNRVISAESASFSFTAQPATLTYSGYEAPETPSKRTITINSQSRAMTISSTSRTLTIN